MKFNNNNSNNNRHPVNKTPFILVIPLFQLTIV